MQKEFVSILQSKQGYPKETHFDSYDFHQQNVKKRECKKLENNKSAQKEENNKVRKMKNKNYSN